MNFLSELENFLTDFCYLFLFCFVLYIYLYTYICSVPVTTNPVVKIFNSSLAAEVKYFNSRPVKKGNKSFVRVATLAGLPVKVECFNHLESFHIIQNVLFLSALFKTGS